MSSISRFDHDTIVEPMKARISELEAEKKALREAIQQAYACGMVPVSSAREGGANRHIRQLQVADMLRDLVPVQEQGND